MRGRLNETRRVEVEDSEMLTIGLVYCYVIIHLVTVVTVMCDICWCSTAVSAKFI